MKVQKTFDEAAGPVRIPPHCIICLVEVSVCVNITFFCSLPRQDDRLDAKRLMVLFNSGSSGQTFHVCL